MKTSGVTGGTRASLKLAPGFGLSFRSSTSVCWISFDRVVRPPADHRQAVVFEVFQVVGDQRLKLFEQRHAGRELQEEALAEVAGGDAGRVELLHQRQRPLGQRQLLRLRLRAQEVFQPALQVSVGVEVVDDPLGHRAERRVQLEPAQLIVEVILEGLRPGGHVRHGVQLPLARLLLLRPRRTAPLLEVVRPFLVHLHQALEVVLVAVRLVDDQFAFFLGGGVRGGLVGRVDRLGGQVRVVLRQIEHRDFPPSPARSALPARGWAVAESPSTGSSAAPAPASATVEGLVRGIAA